MGDCSYGGKQRRHGQKSTVLSDGTDAPALKKWPIKGMCMNMGIRRYAAKILGIRGARGRSSAMENTRLYALVFWKLQPRFVFFFCKGAGRKRPQILSWRVDALCAGVKKAAIRSA